MKMGMCWSFPTAGGSPGSLRHRSIDSSRHSWQIALWRIWAQRPWACEHLAKAHEPTGKSLCAPTARGIKSAALRAKRSWRSSGGRLPRGRARASLSARVPTSGVTSTCAIRPAPSGSPVWTLTNVGQRVCRYAGNVIVMTGGESDWYGYVDPALAQRIVNEHVLAGDSGGAIMHASCWRGRAGISEEEQRLACERCAGSPTDKVAAQF